MTFMRASIDHGTGLDCGCYQSTASESTPRIDTPKGLSFMGSGGRRYSSRYFSVAESPVDSCHPETQLDIMLLLEITLAFGVE